MLIFYFFWRTTGSNTEVKKSSIYGITVEVTLNGVEFIVTTTFFSLQVAYVEVDSQFQCDNAKITTAAIQVGDDV